MLFLVFFLSGATGLIYESLWVGYLKLYLGHAAYAQSLVLVTFMGALAVGARLAGGWVTRLRRPLLAYAVVELGIGMAALMFPQLFAWLHDATFEWLIPSTNLGDALPFVKWLLASLLIVPQTLLLGATFPLMVAALAAADDRLQGRTIANVYLLNSGGAAIGVLVCGFYLVPEFGLPASMRFAGTLNIVLALLVLLHRHTVRPPQPTGKGGRTLESSQLLWVAALSGLASFLYEIAWIRMLSLVLGSSVHAFELMLSAFISGLAIGGWLIRSRIDGLMDPRKALAWVQIAMGFLAAGTLVFYNQTFDWMGLVVRSLPADATGYLLFNLASHAIAFCFMLPATICAGMMLPLVAHILVREGHGEVSIGRVYAVNTLGSLLGVVAAVHLLLPLIGLKAVVVIGATLDMLLGIWLIVRGPLGYRAPPLAAAAALLLGLGIGFGAQFDSARMAAGVFLGRTVNPEREVVFHADGKTASVDVIRNGDHLAIATNAKVDAAVRDSSPTKDEPTMALLAVIPQAMKPDIRRAAVIGFGSGITSHVLLGSETLEELDTVEIEPAMVAGGHWFERYNHRVYSDPRSRIHIEDAKTFLAARKRPYDLIVSEPSNPWVSGVAGLFSQEYYVEMRRRLNEDGLFAQWLHIYDFNTELVASVMKGLQRAFPHYKIYALNNTDLLIVAGMEPIPSPSAAVFRQPGFAEVLSRIGVQSVFDFEHRYMGSEVGLRDFFDSYEAPVHSDYAPVLDTKAIRARFLNQNALELQRLRVLPLDVLAQVGEPERRYRDPPTIGTNHGLYSAALAREAYELLALADGRANHELTPDLMEAWASVTDPNCELVDGIARAIAVQKLASAAVPYLSGEQWLRLQRRFAAVDCAAYDHNAFVTAVAVGDYARAAALGADLSADELAPAWATHRETLMRMAGLGGQHPGEPKTLEQRFFR